MKLFEYNLFIADASDLDLVIEYLINRKIIQKSYYKIGKFNVPCVRIKSDKNYVTLRKIIKKIVGNKFILKR